METDYRTSSLKSREEIKTVELVSCSTLLHFLAVGIATKYVKMIRNERHQLGEGWTILFFKKKQRRKIKTSEFQPRMIFFSLNKRFSKASKSIYLFNERASWCHEKASQHFEKLATLALVVLSQSRTWHEGAYKPISPLLSQHSSSTAREQRHQLAIIANVSLKEIYWQDWILTY